MGSPNIYVSNGTCYFAAGKEFGSQFLPCGNDLYGRKPCCQAGDLCLSNNACYNPPWGVTYLAGCSDPSYSDASCPDKDIYTESPWVGLVYCNGTSDEWVACGQAAQPTTLTKPDTCWCPETTSRTVAFTAVSTLAYEASLPISSGQSVAWQLGYIPTAPSDPSAPATSIESWPGTGSVSKPTTGSAVIATVTVVQSAPPSGGSITTTSVSQTLTSGAKIGIGVGVGAFGVAALGLLAALIIRRRCLARRRNSEGPDGSEAKSGDGEEVVGNTADGTSHEDKHSPDAAAAGANLSSPVSQSTPSELEPRAARPWSLRSELAARGENVHDPEMGEMAGSEGWGPSRAAVSFSPGAGPQKNISRKNAEAAPWTAAATVASSRSRDSEGTTTLLSPVVPSSPACPQAHGYYMHEYGSGDATTAATGASHHGRGVLHGSSELIASGTTAADQWDSVGSPGLASANVGSGESRGCNMFTQNLVNEMP